MDINNTKTVKKSVFRQETIQDVSDIPRSASPASSHCSCPKSDDERDSGKGSGDEEEKKMDLESGEKGIYGGGVKAICT